MSKCPRILAQKQKETIERHLDRQQSQGINDYSNNVRERSKSVHSEYDESTLDFLESVDEDLDEAFESLVNSTSEKLAKTNSFGSNNNAKSNNEGNTGDLDGEFDSFMDMLNSTIDSKLSPKPLTESSSSSNDLPLEDQIDILLRTDLIDSSLNIKQDVRNLKLIVGGIKEKEVTNQEVKGLKVQMELRFKQL